jgi:hypothetical protein
MRTVNFTPRKNIVRYQTRVAPTIVKVDDKVIPQPKEEKFSEEIFIVVRDPENFEIVLDSTKNIFVLVKSLTKTLIKPDVNKIDDEWDELHLEKGACVHLQFVEDTWLITSSDGIKFD